MTIHQPEHLPWLGLLAKVAAADRWVVLDSVPFRKNYFQNRNRVPVGGRPVWLTVPVSAHLGTPIHEVAISDVPKWRQKYLARYHQAYEGAPFWETAKKLVPLIEHDHVRLVDLNLSIIEWLCHEYEIDTPTVRSSELPVSGAKTDLLIEILLTQEATHYLAGPSGRDYLVRDRFAAAGIELEFFDFEHPEYPQETPEFARGMAAVDALAHVGADARSLIHGCFEIRQR